MRRPRPDDKISLSERVATACVAVVAALVTLALCTLALFVFALGRPGGGARVAAATAFYGVMLSNVGIAIVVSAGVAGFWLGSERMANIFSFFWGTHAWWKRARFCNVPLSILVLVLVAVVAFAIWKYTA